MGKKGKRKQKRDEHSNEEAEPMIYKNETIDNDAECSVTEDKREPSSSHGEEEIVENENSKCSSESTEKGSDEDMENNDKQKRIQYDETHEQDEQTPHPKKKTTKKLDLAQAKDYATELENRGVVYISRIPPQMGPSKVKSLLSTFGTITRIHLVEEDATVRKRRRKGGGGWSKRYTEGWIEFSDRKLAKRIALELNNTPITDVKRSVHYGDLWNLKFLKKYPWSHLTEKLMYERRVREQKLRLEVMHAKKENAAFKREVEKGRTLDRIEERRKRKGKVDEKEGGHKKKVRQLRPLEEDKVSAKKPVLDSLL